MNKKYLLVESILNEEQTYASARGNGIQDGVGEFGPDVIAMKIKKYGPPRVVAQYGITKYLTGVNKLVPDDFDKKIRLMQQGTPGIRRGKRNPQKELEILRKEIIKTRKKKEMIRRKEASIQAAAKF